MRNQRALELQINTIEEGVEDEPGSSSLGKEFGLPEGAFNHFCSSEQFDAEKPTPPAPHPASHKLCPSVKNGEVGLPEHDVTDVTSLHSTPPLEEGFDSAKSPPTAPHPKPCYLEAEPMVMIPHSATELYNLQEKISNCPKENTGNVLKISLMGSEIKLSEEGATYYVKSLNL